MKELIGKKVNYFSAGKVKRSRLWEVEITNVIPFNEANSDLLEKWKWAKKYDYDFANETDFFFETIDRFGEKQVFARFKDTKWVKNLFYSFGDFGGVIGSGLLDWSGKLTQSLVDFENKYKK